MSATGFAGQQHFTQGQWKYVPHLSQPDPTLAVVIPTHDERTIQRLQEVTSFIRWEKKQNFDSVSWTTPESELKSMFGCCFAVPPCIAAASGFHNLAAWKPEERLSVTFYFKMLTATSSSWWFSQPWQHWNTWAIIAIIIRRIVINLQLCDEAIKDTTQDRPSMIHGHTLTVPLLESPRYTCTRVYINIIMTFYTSSYKLTQTQIWPLPLKNIINRWGQDLSLLVFRLKASPSNTFALRTNCCLMMGLNIFMLVWAQNWLWHFILKN